MNILRLQKRGSHDAGSGACCERSIRRRDMLDERCGRLKEPGSVPRPWPGEVTHATEIDAANLAVSARVNARRILA
jgi:hypothetical protein